MLRRAHRFHGHNALRQVYGRSQSVRGPLLTLKYRTRFLPPPLASRQAASGPVSQPGGQTIGKPQATNQSTCPYRAAVVVSRKVHKSAVVRNRIRRRIFEVIRRSEPYMLQPYDLVFSVFSDQLATMPAAELEQLVRNQLKKAGTIRTAG